MTTIKMFSVVTLILIVLTILTLTSVTSENSMILCVFMFIGSAGSATGLCYYIYKYADSKHTVELLNNEYGTWFTTEQMFYSPSIVLNRIDEIKGKGKTNK